MGMSMFMPMSMPELPELVRNIGMIFSALMALCFLVGVIGGNTMETSIDRDNRSGVYNAKLMDKKLSLQHVFSTIGEIPLLALFFVMAAGVIIMVVGLFATAILSFFK